MQKTILCLIIMCLLLVAVGCGGNSGGKTASTGPRPSPTPVASPTPSPAPTPIDPSGNWKMSFTDSNNVTFILSALFSQTGDVVTSVNFSEAGEGNVDPGFTCVVQRDISMTGGLVQNVSNFVGTINGNFGSVAFNSTLNNAGNHAVGSYTITPPQTGNCTGVALTGTFTGDEVPSMSATWTGTVTCMTGCPTETPAGTTGTISATLVQNDATGTVSGTYTVTGLLPGLSAGMLIPDVNNLLSGSSIAQRLQDNTGNVVVLVGGPLNSFGTPGLQLDGSFGGNIIAPNLTQNTVYAVSMNH